MILIILVQRRMTLVVRMMVMHVRVACPGLARNSTSNGRSYDVEDGGVDTPTSRVGSHGRQAVDEPDVVPGRRWWGYIPRRTGTGSERCRVSGSRLGRSKTRSTLRTLAVTKRHVLVMVSIRRSHGWRARTGLTSDPRPRLKRKSALWRRCAKVRPILRSTPSSFRLMRVHNSAHRTGLDGSWRRQVGLVLGRSLLRDDRRRSRDGALAAHPAQHARPRGGPRPVTADIGRLGHALTAELDSTSEHPDVPSVISLYTSGRPWTIGRVGSGRRRCSRGSSASGRDDGRGRPRSNRGH